MISPSIVDKVGQVLREAAEEAILPRFRSLRSGEIQEKSPGDHVTVADREAERLIAEGLLALLPGSRVIGEELASEQPEVMGSLCDDQIWVVDPLDGTTNFVEGIPLFAVMVALLQRGEPVASWILQPTEDRLLVAERGSGAFDNGHRIWSLTDAVPGQGLRGAALNRFMPADVRTHIESRSSLVQDVRAGLRCAGFEYPAVVSGEQHFAVFWRTLPWDHVPGALFTTEAGGHVARFDGRPYMAADQSVGLLVAQNRAIWNNARDAFALSALA